MRISTDAGISLKKKKGHFAFCISHNGIEYRRSGALQDDIGSSSDAEGKCIINALYFAKNVFLPCLNEAIDEIDVFTDSEVAIMCLCRPHQGSGKWTLKHELRYYFEYFRLDKLPVVFNHVKGHNKKPVTDEDFENIWCDKAAQNAKVDKLVNSIYSSNNLFDLDKFISITKSEITNEHGFRRK